MSAELNEQRLIAAAIITTLFEANALGQIQLLLMQCSLSNKSLDPEGHIKFVRSQLPFAPKTANDAEDACRRIAADFAQYGYEISVGAIEDAVTAAKKLEDRP